MKNPDKGKSKAERRKAKEEVIACDRCGVELVPGRRYRLVLSLQQVAEPLVVRPADLAKDLVAEMEKIIAELEGVDIQKLEDDIAAFFAAQLCRKCRDAWLERLRALAR